MNPPMSIAAAALGLIVSVTSGDLERALTLGRAQDRERTRFHAPYVLVLDDATVERMEILTEFRRAVTIIEQRALVGDRMFGLAQLTQAVRPFHNRVTIRATLRFHPQNALPGIPSYELRVGDTADRLLALGPTSRAPIYVSVSDDPTASQALMGTTLEIDYDSGVIGQGRYPVGVFLDGKTVVSAPVEFGRLE